MRFLALAYRYWTSNRQGYYFHWHTGIALAYRHGRRSFSLFCSTLSKVDENRLGFWCFLFSSKINDENKEYPVLQEGIFRYSRGREFKKFFSAQASKPPSFPILFACFTTMGSQLLCLLTDTNHSSQIGQRKLLPLT